MDPGTATLAAAGVSALGNYFAGLNTASQADEGGVARTDRMFAYLNMQTYNPDSGAVQALTQAKKAMETSMAQQKAQRLGYIQQQYNQQRAAGGIGGHQLAGALGLMGNQFAQMMNEELAIRSSYDAAIANALQARNAAQLQKQAAQQQAILTPDKYGNAAFGKSGEVLSGTSETGGFSPELWKQMMDRNKWISENYGQTGMPTNDGAQPVDNALNGRREFGLRTDARFKKYIDEGGSDDYDTWLSKQSGGGDVPPGDQGDVQPGDQGDVPPGDQGGGPALDANGNPVPTEPGVGNGDWMLVDGEWKWTLTGGNKGQGGIIDDSGTGSGGKHGLEPVGSGGIVKDPVAPVNPTIPTIPTENRGSEPVGSGGIVKDPVAPVNPTIPTIPTENRGSDVPGQVGSTLASAATNVLNNTGTQPVTDPLVLQKKNGNVKLPINPYIPLGSGGTQQGGAALQPSITKGESTIAPVDQKLFTDLGVQYGGNFAKKYPTIESWVAAGKPTNRVRASDLQIPIDDKVLAMSKMGLLG